MNLREFLFELKKIQDHIKYPYFLLSVLFTYFIIAVIVAYLEYYKEIVKFNLNRYFYC